MAQKKPTLDERLKNHPGLLARFERILDIAELKDPGSNTADEAEERTIAEVRKLGEEVMQDWAEGKTLKDVEDYRAEHPESAILKKKGPTGIPPLEKSE